MSFDPEQLHEEGGDSDKNILYTTTNNVRWLLFEWFLQQSIIMQTEHGTEDIIAVTEHFNKLLVVEIEDILFLSSPFSSVSIFPPSNSKEGTIFVLSEGPDKTIAPLPPPILNELQHRVRNPNPNPNHSPSIELSLSIESCLGTRVANLLLGQSIITTSFFLGSITDMKKLLQKVATVLRGEFQCFPSNYPSCIEGAIVNSDLSAINGLVHMGHLSDIVQIVNHMSFPILDLQSYPLYSTHPIDNSNLIQIASRRRLVEVNQLPNTKIGRILTENLSKEERVDTVFVVDEAATWVQKKIANNESPSYEIIWRYKADAILYPSLLLEYAPFTVLSKSSTSRLGSAVVDFIQTASCRNYGIMIGVDVLKGQCDVASIQVSSMAECCHKCTAQGRGRCSAFTFASSSELGVSGDVGGSCYLKQCTSNEDLYLRLSYTASSQFNDASSLSLTAASAYIR